MEKVNIRFFSVIVYVIIFLFASCSKDGDPSTTNTEPIITDKGTPQGTASSLSIGPSGGTVQSDDGKVVVTIPVGALTSTTTVSIQPISNEGPLGLGLAYRLQPEGTTFAVPVTIAFKYDDKMLTDTVEDFLWIITQADNGSWNAMLRSELDINTNTVTVKASHFSDWALGKFVDLSLAPSSKTVKKGESVNLKITGFASAQEIEGSELVPLQVIVGDGLEMLTPLTPIPAVESRLMEFRVKGWTLNGAAAPVSNSNGSLSASNMTAAYTAPGKKPSINPVAVSVNLESNNKEGKKSSYLLNANISVVESEKFIVVRIDGNEYEYYQYGFDGTAPPDENNYAIANCGIEDNMLSIVGSEIINGSTLASGFALTIEGPSEGSHPMHCAYDEGKDALALGIGQTHAYVSSYVKRTKVKNSCDTESLCAEMTVTFIAYESKQNGNVRGYFSGNVYEGIQGDEAQCKTPEPHTIEGEFWLVKAN